MLKICLSESLANRLTTLGVRLKRKLSMGIQALPLAIPFLTCDKDRYLKGQDLLGLGALALESGCRHVRCHHKNEAIVKKGQNNINVLGANE